MQRLFFALELPASQKTAITNWHNKQLPELNKAVVSDNLHLTLCFLGNVNDDIAQHLTSTVIDLPFQTFEVTFSTLGLFKKPKVLYLNPDIIPPSLINLSLQINQLANQHGIVTEHQKYHPHITIAKKVNQLPQLTSTTSFKIRFKNVVLYHSKSTTYGVKYIKLASWPLS